MTRARKTLVNTADTPYYHCINRCVRRAFLCGDDKFTGRNYDHRKQWLVDRFKLLSTIFTIDICAYAVMSNHYHLVLKIDDQSAKQLSDGEVIKRWTSLFKGPVLVQRYLAHIQQTQAELNEVANIVSEWRERLANLGWFMGCINEKLARESNFEDKCTGRFWEGRYKSYALLDDRALLTCMAYVDLNPIRAGMVESLEESDYTSIQERLFAAAKARKEKVVDKSDPSSQPSTLVPFLGNEKNDKSCEGVYYFVEDYLVLVDWTGREVKGDKSGAIPLEVKPILDKLNFSPDDWLEYSEDLMKPYRRRRVSIAKFAA